jgi:hypothetical protein
MAENQDKKRSVGKKILGVLVAIVLVIAVMIGVRAVMDRHEDGPSNNGFDYAIGTCLNLAKASVDVKPSDVQAEPCSSPTALAKVAKKYKGATNCPNDNYGTLQGGGSGLCLQPELTVGSCYHRTMFPHMFAQVTCLPGALDQTLKVTLRRDGADDAGLCSSGQLAANFPEPPLTYCMEVVRPTR